MTTLPEYVEVCGFCEGAGEYVQNYNVGCGGGLIRMLGDCGHCRRMGYVYKTTGEPVGASVVNQIKQAAS